MNLPLRPRRPLRAFMLLEVVLALAVFGGAATGLTVALHQISKAAALTQSEMRITRILDSALEEALSLPTMEEREDTVKVGTSDMEVTTKIEILDKLENQDGQVLQEMWLITVIARWLEDGVWRERAAETWRYGRMYQSS